MKVKSISILGCGWLGLPLGISLINEGCKVNGSTKTPSKLEVLKKNGINPFLVELTPELKGENLNEFFNSDLLILNVPPSYRNDLIEFHFNQIKSVRDAIQNSNCKQIIFISSTSVYGNCNCEVDEESKVDPETESGKALVKVEEFLQSQNEIKTTILRFGGLFGDDRNPAKFALQRAQINNADAPLNFIHLNDCLGLIKVVIKKGIDNIVLNGVSEVHPTRKEFYTLSANKYNLPLPVFIEGKGNFKIVKGDKTKQILDYQYQFSNPLDALK